MTDDQIESEMRKIEESVAAIWSESILLIAAVDRLYDDLLYMRLEETIMDELIDNDLDLRVLLEGGE